MSKEVSSRDLIGMLELKVAELDEHFPQLQGTAARFLEIQKKAAKATNYSGSVTEEEAREYIETLEGVYKAAARQNEHTEKLIESYHKAMSDLGDAFNNLMEAVGELAKAQDKITELKIREAYRQGWRPKAKA